MTSAFLLVLFAFAGFSLLLPVVPLQVLRDGGSGVLAGATTGVFMVVTVLVQLVTPRATARIGYRGTLLVGSALLGLPSGLLLLAGGAGEAFSSADATLVLAVCAVRGAGFGMVTVSGSALVAELAPPGALGRATSLVGFAVGLSEMVFLPAGLAAFEGIGMAAVVWPATALGVIGIVAAATLPDVRPAPPEDDEEDAPPMRALVRRLVAPFVVMLAVSMPYGAATTFLSTALDTRDAGSGALAAGLALGLLGGAIILGRTYAGSVSDRRGPGTLAPVGLVLGTLGMAGLTALLVAGASPWWALPACLLFGAGFGIVQSEALITSFESMPRSRVSSASASWNMSFDSGTGLGSLALGSIAALGYPVLFGVAAIAVAVVGTPAAVAMVRRNAAATGPAPAVEPIG